MEADVNARGFLGNTALSRACCKGHTEIVQLLLENEDITCVNECNDKQQYPLHFAAFKKKRACVEAMLASEKVITTMLDRKGRTPAEDTSDAEIRDMILKRRAEVETK